MQKNCDSKNRWRNKIVSFRMSPDEATQLDTYVKVSGLTKQDYLIHRVFAKEIIVNGNPRVFKALRNQLENVLIELRRTRLFNTDNEELIETIRFIAEILNGLKENKDDK